MDYLVFQHGTLTVYLKQIDAPLALEPFVGTIPEGVPIIWHDSAREHPITGRWSMVGFDPWLTFRADSDRIELRTSASTRVWRDHPLKALRQLLRRYGSYSPSSLQGRAVGLMGFLSYDLNRWIESLPPPQPSGEPIPDMLWFGMRVVILVDHLKRHSWLFSIVDPHSPKPLAHRQALDALDRVAVRLIQKPAHETVGDSGEDSAVLHEDCRPEATSRQSEFEAMVLRALEHIRCGNIFQANVAQRFTTSWRRGALPLYRRLRRVNPSPFACYMSYNDLDVVSCSPERLVTAQDGHVAARPIAGTRPRGASPRDDAVNSLELLLSEKERAEHIMLVDLARNDLGRICAVGSVSVGELMTLEIYSHVIHIVSDVSGFLRPGIDAVDIIRAVFPGGTITGCPKVKCMEILRELEPVARGLYTGSLGFLGFDGTMDLNIAIRTIVINNGVLSFHVGAGIVADSKPEREYQETLDKAAALVAALRGSKEAIPSAYASSR